VPGLELATRLILDICGGEASEVVVAGQAPALPAPFDFDPAHVARLSGLTLGREGVVAILERLGFEITSAAGTLIRVQPPSWRRDVEGPADLVEEVARIAGYDQLPSTPLPEVARLAGGVLSQRQSRIQRARRYLASRGYGEAITWSFTSREAARAFGGGSERLVLENPISPDLDCMRPTPLPNLIRAAQRNAARGRPDLALFEIGPVYGGDQPEDQKTVISALVSPRPPRHWAGQDEDPLFALKADLLGLMDAIGAPTASLQLVQGSNPPWWHPGRSARLQLGPKGVMAHFGALHPGVLRGLDAEAPLLAFEIVLDAVPEPRARTGKSRGSAALSPLMPLTRDFAFVVDESVPAQDVIRAVSGADKALIREVRVFDVYRGERIGEGKVSLALEVVIEPSEATLTEAEIEALSSRIVAAAGKVGALLRA
jgi:phenylalanyl-tRNA synthetase beta chain